MHWRLDFIDLSRHFQIVHFDFLVVFLFKRSLFLLLIGLLRVVLLIRFVGPDSPSSTALRLGYDHIDIPVIDVDDVFPIIYDLFASHVQLHERSLGIKENAKQPDILG